MSVPSEEAIAASFESQLLEQALEAFLDELRAGSSPSVSDYTAQYPEIADQLREVLPTLAMLDAMANGSTAPVTSSIPAQIGQYQVLRKIGSGGMGVVYEAHHSVLKRRVALKVLSSGLLNDATQFDRFERETRIVGHLHHTNIVPLFEAGTHDGVPYYAMQYIAGISVAGLLAEVVRRREEVMPSSRRSAEVTETTAIEGKIDSVVRDMAESDDKRFHHAATIALQVADALKYAHAHGVLHRDIKPANLLLDREGTTWVTDFGLAKTQADELTRSGDVVGTIRYMPPERFSSDGDERGDLYSLGLTLYELCTLRPAFGENDPVRLYREVLQHQPQHPRAVEPRIPGDLETIIQKAIAPDPAHRYQSAGDFEEDLRLFLDNRPIRSRRIGVAERIRRWCSRNPLTSALVGASVFLAISLIFVSLLAAYRSKRQLALVEQANLAAQQRLYESYRGRAQAFRWSGQPGQHFQSLQALSQAATLIGQLPMSPETRENQRYLLRNEAIAALGLTDVTDLKRWSLAPGQTPVVAYDAGFSQYAVVDAAGNIDVRRVADERLVRRLTGLGDPCWNLKMSPNGRFLAGVFHPSIPQRVPPLLRLWDLSTGDECLRLNDIPYRYSFIFLGREMSEELQVTSKGQGVSDDQGEDKPDEEVTRLLVTSDTRKLSLFEARSGGSRAEQLRQINLEFPVESICALDKGRIAVAPTKSHRVLFFDILDRGQQGPVGSITLEDVEEISVLAFSPFSRTLAIGTATTGDIFLVQLEQPDQTPRQLRGHAGRVTLLHFASRGDLLASTAWDTTTRFWDPINLSESLRIPGVTLADPGFGHDARRLGYMGPGTSFGIWNVSHEGPLSFLQQDPNIPEHWMVAFHPKQPDLLAVATKQGIELWDCTRKARVGLLRNHRVRSVVFSADGKHVYGGGDRGIVRYRLTVSSDEPNWMLEVGKAEVVFSQPVYRCDVGQSGDRIVAVGDRRTAWILSADSGNILTELSGHEPLDRVYFSPDERWVVTTTWSGSGIRVWDADSGEMVKELAPRSGSASVAFSPDGKYLAGTCGHHQWIWRVGTWEECHSLGREEPDGWPGPVTFSPDSRMIVFPQNRFVARLVDASSGDPLAVLPAPNPASLAWYGVSPDSRYLAVAQSRSVQLWDLERLRYRLRLEGLDWELKGMSRDGNRKHAR